MITAINVFHKKLIVFSAEVTCAEEFLYTILLLWLYLLIIVLAPIKLSLKRPSFILIAPLVPYI